ncbi:MAG TPA: LuxR C-terminal-related transcriptional regulator, partial [Acidimicrobiales bacterium]|nr:LuxR C-terminal-related transcriptional regulator [Acidimicrobiales bacterium]
LPGGGALLGSIEESFGRRVERLPPETRRLLLLAAADPLGDPVMLWRAAERLAIDATAARPAVQDGLVSLGSRVQFRHPLVRSAVYREAADEDRRAAHAALAAVTDPAVDPERRAWHRAEAAAGPDEDVAAELERYADRAQARGGVAAAAAFLERAATLSPDPAVRAGRALAAARAKVHAGAFSSALDLLAMAEAGPLGEAGLAHAALVRAQLAFATSHGSDAPPSLLQAARQLEPIDVGLARATYLDALLAAMLAGGLADPGADLGAVVRAVVSAPRPPHGPTPLDLLLDGLAATYSEGYGAGVPLLRAAVSADTAGMPADQELRWLQLGWWVASHLWEDDRAAVLADRYVRFARDVGALSELAFGIDQHAVLLFMQGEPAAAATEVEESYAAKAALGLGHEFVSSAMALAAWRGEEDEASRLFALSEASAAERGDESSVMGVEWARAVLCNGLGRYPEALAAALRAVTDREQLGLRQLALSELIEAAPRAGHAEAAANAREELAEMAAAVGTNWVLGIQARARALITGGDTAEDLHRTSIDHLAGTRARAQLARAHLLFGEWLRRERRRAEARDQLRTAVEMLEAMEMEAFAERARRELRATGETARKRSVETAGDLTPQEAQVAMLAREGLSNPEIAARLYISARTVQYHLGKVFAKLGITSRSQLHRALG